MTTAMAILGVLTLLSAIGVVFGRKPLDSALWLVVTFFFVAGHYALLGADFLAALQLLVYAGAIMVLIIFVIMLLGLNNKSECAIFRISGFLALAAVVCFVGVMIYYFKSAEAGFANSATEQVVVVGSAREVGKILFENYYFALQIVGLLLLAAIIGAALLAKEPRRPLAPGRGLSWMQNKLGSGGQS